MLRKRVAFYDHDRLFAPDIAAAKAVIASDELLGLVPSGLKVPDLVGPVRRDAGALPSIGTRSQAYSLATSRSVFTRTVALSGETRKP